MATLFFVLFAAFAVIIGISIFGLSKLPPDERKKVCDEMNRKVAQGIDQWNEERRQIRAVKRARNAALWTVVGKIVKRL